MIKLKLLSISILAIIVLSSIIANQPAHASTKNKPLPIKKVRVRSYQNRTLKVTWKKTRGADGYQIYRYEPKKKKFVKAGEVEAGKKAWISPKVKKKQTYKVRAFRKNGRKKCMGNSVMRSVRFFIRSKRKRLMPGGLYQALLIRN